MRNERGIPRLMRVLALGIPFVLAGCGVDGLFGSDRSRVRVVVSGDDESARASVVAASLSTSGDDDKARDKDKSKSDRLSSWFESAQVIVSSVMFRSVDGELVDAHMDLPVTVDLVKVEGGRQFVLPDGFLPDDTYDQVVLVMTAIRGTTRDGTVITIEPPGGGWTAVVPICALEVDGHTETVGLRLQVRDSFLRGGDRWSFQPRFRTRGDCDDDDD
jgi:hypothetical protein